MHQCCCYNQCNVQGSCGSLKVPVFFPDFQGLGSHLKQTWSLKVLEFDFLKCRDRTSDLRISVVTSLMHLVNVN